MNQTIKSANELFNINLASKPNVVIMDRSLIAKEVETFLPTLKYHLFTEDQVIEMLEYNLSGFLDGAHFITGQRGVGKSSTVEQFYARLGVPVVRVNGHINMEISDLIGSFQLVDGSTVWNDGPLTLAAKHNAIFLLDEADAVPPEVMIGLNQINERSNFTIPETQESVELSPMFRVIYAGNTAGHGDENGEYAGTNIQNSASMDRFSFSNWSYLGPNDELEVIKRSVKMGNELDIVVRGFIAVANQTREATSEIPDISTRSLIRWVRKMVVFRGKPFKYSFDRAIGMRYPKDIQDVLNKICESCLGTDEFYGVAP